MLVCITQSAIEDLSDRLRWSAQEEKKIMEVQDRHTERLMAIQGVVGTATGLAADGGAAIKVYTKAPGLN